MRPCWLICGLFGCGRCLICFCWIITFRFFARLMLVLLLQGSVVVAVVVVVVVCGLCFDCDSGE